ncbi:hypothetical protein, partial [Rhizobium wenxiniae]|uniref:hypothetical protein n=1 Tax=Rhizobium wenxiniae TaxID=1737357 RepID=UPI001C6EE538
DCMSTAETTVLPAQDEFAGLKDVERKSRKDVALATRQRSTLFKIRLTRCRRLDNEYELPTSERKGALFQHNTTNLHRRLIRLASRRT